MRSAARRSSPRKVQEQRFDASGVGDRLKLLGKPPKPLGRVRDTLRSAKPLRDASHTFDQLMAFLKKKTLSRVFNKLSASARDTARLQEKPSHRIAVFGEFTVEVTGRLTGWRVTTTNQATGIQHEFYVHDDVIHHVMLPLSAEWNNSTQFVVGCRVRQIMDSEKWAILQGVRGVRAGESKIQRGPTRESWY
jgi:hypothetical protein